MDQESVVLSEAPALSVAEGKDLHPKHNEGPPNQFGGPSLRALHRPDGHAIRAVMRCYLSHQTRVL